MAHKRKAKDGNTVTESDGASDDDVKAPPEKKLDQRDWSPYEQPEPLSLSKNETNRRSASGSPAANNAPETEDASSNGNKDDEDDENDDDNEDEKMDAQYDAERLKAFNMFVRLFVDENLDRIVPISKQPKEKIQAIIDACGRQFPEFSERTRKRIRTYLKSCRRNKKARDTNGWENSRPTPPHLTSIQAEQILATACENEAENAKRMRRGLEPISQPNPLTASQSQTSSSDKTPALLEAAALAKSESSKAPMVNGTTSIYQTAFPQGISKPSSTVHSQQTVSMLLSSGAGPSSGTTGSTLANGPTDLSIKGTKSQTRPTLNAIEVAAVRQLITGYRESAAFLLRSADELENLLVQQSTPSNV